jgi:hypothetical protein
MSDGGGNGCVNATRPRTKPPKQQQNQRRIARLENSREVAVYAMIDFKFSTS